VQIAAIDLGSRRIGVAVSDEAGIGAHPLGIVKRRALEKDLQAIREMISDRDVGLIVVGLPLNMDGSEGAPAVSARKFAAQLALELRITVEMFDERLTTFEARDRLDGKPVRKGMRKRGVDALAAVVILEGWMQAHPESLARR
jgi:putative holliday junction resolvase